MSGPECKWWFCEMNDFITAITVDQKGVQTSYPMNADGSANYGINYNINRQYKTTLNLFTTGTSVHGMVTTGVKLYLTDEQSFQESV
jgi:hypothetical protein